MHGNIARSKTLLDQSPAPSQGKRLDKSTFRMRNLLLLAQFSSSKSLALSAMRPLTLLALLCSASSLALSTPGDGCCPTLSVADSPADRADLNGVYRLATGQAGGPKRADVCMDGCVYVKDEDEFCFVKRSKGDDPNAACEVGKSHRVFFSITLFLVLFGHFRY